MQHLLKQEELNLDFSISATSREPRRDEVHGKNYYFISLKDFKQHIKDGNFLEWEEVYRDNFYGTLKTEIERIWAKGKNVIFDIDVVGIVRKRMFHDLCPVSRRENAQGVIPSTYSLKFESTEGVGKPGAIRVRVIVVYLEIRIQCYPGFG